MKKALSFLIAMAMVITMIPVFPGTVFNAAAAGKKITDYSQGDHVEFGWYPQSKVTDESLKTQLTAKAGSTDNWTSYNYYTSDTDVLDDGNMYPSDYMRYTDVMLNGSKYRGVHFTKYRKWFTGYTADTSTHCTDQDDNGYYINTIYWFKFEPVSWRVLDPSKGLVLCENIIDSQAYSNYILYSGSDAYGWYAVWGDASKTYYANNYAESSIREWLNNDFYNTAFSPAQQNIIKATTLDNKAFSSKYSEYDSATTTDKIYLLSDNDALNADYGFRSDRYYDDPARQARGTDYAKAQGGWTSSSVYTDWWLRTPGDYSISACSVILDGYVSNNYYSVGDPLGVRPAFNFDLSSVIFQSDISETGLKKDESSSPSEDNDDLSSDETPDAFIKKHVIKYKSMFESYKEYGFSSTTKDNSQLTINQIASRIWDTIKDAGEIATLSLDDLQINADYYDVYLGDMMLAFAEKTIPGSLSWKAGDYYKKGFSTVENFLKSSKDYYQLEDILGVNDISSAFDDDYKLSESVKQTFSKVFKNADQNKLAQIYQGFDCANEICDLISTGSDAFNSFKECYQAYCVSRATKEVTEEFFTICYDVVKEMKKNNSKYAGWFKDSVDRFYNNRQSDMELFLAAKSAFEGAKLTYDTFIKSAGKKVVYNGVAKALSSISGKVITVGQVVGVIAAWNVGTFLGDLIAAKDTESQYYMFYVSPVEAAIQAVAKKYGDNMVKYNDLDSTRKYEIAFQTLKYTNVALYGKAYNFAAKHKFLWFKTETMKENMEIANLYKALWENYSCHGENKNNATKTVSIQCPVDVCFKDSTGATVLRIENEQIIKYSNTSFVVDIFDGKKTVTYPATGDYTVDILPYDTGIMNYHVYSYADELFRQIEFNNVDLTVEQSFNGEIPQDINALVSEYTLMSNINSFEPNMDESVKMTLPVEQSYSSGDVDGDGNISAADARLALRRSVGLEAFEEDSPEFLACDVDFDGTVSAADARLILRASVGLEDPTSWKKA